MSANYHSKCPHCGQTSGCGTDQHPLRPTPRPGESCNQQWWRVYLRLTSMTGRSVEPGDEYVIPRRLDSSPDPTWNGPVHRPTNSPHREEWDRLRHLERQR